MRKSVLFVLSLLLVLVGAVVVWADQGDRAAAVDRQSFAWTDEAVETSSTEWAYVSGLAAGTNRCQGNRAAAATASLDLEEGSSPVDIRVVMDDPLRVCIDCTSDQVEGVLKPEEVTLTNSGSFTFVTPRSVGDHGTDFAVQWRLAEDAPPNASATMRKGTLVVLWKVLKGLCQ